MPVVLCYLEQQFYREQTLSSGCVHAEILNNVIQKLQTVYRPTKSKQYYLNYILYVYDTVYRRLAFSHFFINNNYLIITIIMKKALRETQTLRARWL